jgi:AcrR family transcriptional regulator
MTTARRGPRNDVDVPTILLDTAERLFGTSSPHEVSLRAVAREAGVAPAAVSHHFASKQDLVKAVIKRRSRKVGLQLHAGLTALRDAEQAPTPTELVTAVVRPFVGVLNSDPVGGRYWMKIFANVALGGDVVWTDELDVFERTAPLFDAVAMRALPDLKGRAFNQRLAIAMYGLLAVLSGVDLAAYGSPLGKRGLNPAFVKQLIAFTASGLTGPSH